MIRKGGQYRSMGQVVGFSSTAQTVFNSDYTTEICSKLTFLNIYYRRKILLAIVQSIVASKVVKQVLVSTYVIAALHIIYTEILTEYFKYF